MLVEALVVNGILAVLSRRRWLIVITCLGLIALAAVLFNMGPRVFSGDSDTATLVLQAKAVNAGNPLLAGWRMLYDSFLTIEVPFYSATLPFLGPHLVLNYLIPAVLAAATVALACALARNGSKGSAALAAMATTFIVLGLPAGAWASIFLRGAWHIGTLLFCLSAFALLRRATFGWSFAAAVLLLALGLLGDLQTLPLGVAPILGAGVIATIALRRWLGGMVWLAAGFGSVVLALILRQVFKVLGTYDIGTLNPHASGAQMVHNLQNLPRWIFMVFGTSNAQFGYSGVPGWLLATRAAATAAIIVVVVWTVVRIARSLVLGEREVGGWVLDTMLTLGVAATLAFFVWSTLSNDQHYVRYLAGVVIFGSVLTGRTVAMAWGTSIVRPLIIGALVIFGGLYATATLLINVHPAAPAAASDLSAFLERHHLTQGIGGYWDSSVTTVQSGGAVTIRAVTVDPQGRIVRYTHQSSDAWYDGVPFQFLVYDDNLPELVKTDQPAVATFGAVQQSYTVGHYRILTWGHPIYVPALPGY